MAIKLNATKANFVIDLLKANGNTFTPNQLLKVTGNERRARSALSHARLVAFRGAGEVKGGALDGCLYLAMELGQHSLAQRLQRPTQMRSDEVREVALHVAEALAYLGESSAAPHLAEAASGLRSARLEQDSHKWSQTGSVAPTRVLHDACGA